MPAKKRATRAATSTQTEAAQGGKAASSEDHHLMVAEAAYYRALERGFQGGDAEDDWYAAEAEIRKVFRQL